MNSWMIAVAASGLTWAICRWRQQQRERRIEDLIDGLLVDGTEANGTGANGTGANGTGANGTGANGTGANGTGANGTGARKAAEVGTNRVGELAPTDPEPSWLPRLRSHLRGRRAQNRIEVNRDRLTIERLETVLESMEEAVVAVDVDSRILFANRASWRLLRVPAIADGVLLMEAVRSSEVENAVDHVLEHQVSHRFEFELTRPSLILSARATCLPGHGPAGVVLVFSDITELRRLERHRREFVTNVSHELKTPLASIKAFSETLLLGALYDEQANVRFVEKIAEQAERLHCLILDLIQLARIENQADVVEITEFSLSELIENMLQELQALAEKKGIQVVAGALPADLTIVSDQEGVRTILSNLIDNAIRYTNEGQVTVSVSAASGGNEGAGGELTIEVRDTGIGVPKQDLERVFHRFYRVDKARSRALGGTGLGLAIVKNLTQALGGRVGLESTPGVGSVFRVQLPQVAEGADRADRGEAAEEED